jgi:site-specific DNA-methyltransferase (adenine-specific)
LRDRFWPSPFDITRHSVRKADARKLSFIPDDSVHLIVTSPPYWALKAYNDCPNQLGHIREYNRFLDELQLCLAECSRVLAPGGRICCVVGDVCVARRQNKGRHWVAPLHADIQVRARAISLDNLTPVIWHKIANGVTEAAGNGAGYYGKPYQPNGVIKNDVEYILFLRKGGTYRQPTEMQRVLSMLNKEEQRAWYQQIWTDIPGASTRDGHPAPFPVELATRLIRMFSFAGDTVLDPFGGTGTTQLAALREGRNSIGVDIDPQYVRMALRRVRAEAELLQTRGAREAVVESPGSDRKTGE